MLGIPSLILYTFAAWAALVAVLAEIFLHRFARKCGKRTAPLWHSCQGQSPGLLQEYRQGAENPLRRPDLFLRIGVLESEIR